MALVAAVFPLSPQEEEADRGDPLSVISPFLFPILKPVGFRYLIEALKHFLKF